MLLGVGAVDGMLAVVAVGSCSELHGGYIFLGVGLQLLNQFCLLACAENENTCGKRVKGTSVANLHLLAQPFGHDVPHMCECSKARHSVRLVDSHNLAFKEVHVTVRLLWLNVEYQQIVAQRS